LLRSRNLALVVALGAGALTIAAAPRTSAAQDRLDGVNVVVATHHPFGSETAKASLANVRALGARAIAVVPFLRQSSPGDPELRRGSDMPDGDLRAAIRDAHALELKVLVKPHVFVPHSWAGAVAMGSESDWQEWFGNYRRELTRVAQIAEEENAEALSIGTELELTTQRPEWSDLIEAAREAYHGSLIYVAHNVEEAEAVAFWDRLDAIGVTLYPPLGKDDDRLGHLAAMYSVADRLDMLALVTGKSIVVGEIGIRSAAGAAAKPWEGVEERASTPAPGLQAEIIAEWLAVLDRPSISGVLIWEWFTNPDAGGPSDDDFTVQGKPAERVLACAWQPECKHGCAQCTLSAR
jgi:hypothetical protein